MKKFWLLLLPLLLIVTGCSNKIEYMCSDWEYVYRWFKQTTITKTLVCMNVNQTPNSWDDWKCFEKTWCEEIIYQKYK